MSRDAGETVTSVGFHMGKNDLGASTGFFGVAGRGGPEPFSVNPSEIALADFSLLCPQPNRLPPVRLILRDARLASFASLSFGVAKCCTVGEDGGGGIGDGGLPDRFALTSKDIGRACSERGIGAVGVTWETCGDGNVIEYPGSTADPAAGVLSGSIVRVIVGGEGILVELLISLDDGAVDEGWETGMVAKLFRVLRPRVGYAEGAGEVEGTRVRGGAIGGSGGTGGAGDASCELDRREDKDLATPGAVLGLGISPPLRCGVIGVGICLRFDSDGWRSWVGRAGDRGGRVIPFPFPLTACKPPFV